MDVAVVVPWSPPYNGDRSVDVWRWVKARWETCHPQFEVVESTPVGAFSIAEAVNRGVGRVDADIVIVAYADIVVPTQWVVDAVAAVGSGDSGFVTPAVCHAVDALGTLDVVSGPVDADLAVDNERVLELYFGWGGIAVLSRQRFVDCPFDTMFEGHLYEADSWVHANDRVGGGVTRTGESHHLFHGRKVDWSSSPVFSNRVMYEKYMRADDAELGTITRFSQARSGLCQ